jgi:hypothetical protein
MTEQLPRWRAANHLFRMQRHRVAECINRDRCRINMNARERCSWHSASQVEQRLADRLDRRYPD